jgi:hypothetical protein
MTARTFKAWRMMHTPPQVSPMNEPKNALERTAAKRPRCIAPNTSPARADEVAAYTHEKEVIARTRGGKC